MSHSSRVLYSSLYVHSSESLACEEGKLCSRWTETRSEGGKKSIFSVCLCVEREDEATLSVCLSVAWMPLLLTSGREFFVTSRIRVKKKKVTQHSYPFYLLRSTWLLQFQLMVASSSSPLIPSSHLNQARVEWEGERENGAKHRLAHSMKRNVWGRWGKWVLTCNECQYVYTFCCEYLPYSIVNTWVA